MVQDAGRDNTLPGRALVILGLGSNRGRASENGGRDSRQIILDAVKELESLLPEIRAAPLYETAPLHVTDQARFINTAAAGFYPAPAGAPASARELLFRVHEIEARFGRDRTRERRWGERTLDIDILLFGNLALDEPGLTIPHPRLKERRFALEPLLDLEPLASEPGTGLLYRAICDALPFQGVNRL